MRYSIVVYFIFALIACIFFSCSSTKYIPENEYLLDKVHIKSDVSEFGSIELRPYVKQLPNYKMFGLNKTQLQIYNLSGRDSTRWINRQLKKMGEPPVIFDSTLVQRTNLEFRKFFVNKGYINVDVQSEIYRHGKKVDITYFIKSNNPYIIRNYTTSIQDSSVYEAMYSHNNGPEKLPGEPASARIPLVKPGMLFDRNVLDQERDRITKLLRNRGYYTFNKDYIVYDADSTLASNSVDLELKLHLYPEILPNGMYAETPHRKYFLDKVFIYMDYDPLKIMNFGDYMPSDSIKKGNYTIYYKGKSSYVRPGVLMENSFLTPGRPYAQMREDVTYSAYSALRALNSTNIHFEETMRNDSALLNCYILTMPARKQSISFSIDGTNTAGDLGVATSVSYSHRNLFKGSEIFSVKLRGAYEAITDNFDQNYKEIGAETSLTFPKFMFPFLNSSFKRKMRTSTEFPLSFNYQTRPEYDRILLSGGFKYIWQGRGTRTARQQFNLLDINYVYLPRIDSTFKSNLPENARLFSYTNLFIVGMGYSYSFSTYDPLQKQRNVYSFRTSIESAGNALYGLSNLFNAKHDDDGSYTLFNILYAQYLKGDIEYSKTIFIDKQNSIAWRVGGGIGVPYGNSKLLPFDKRYYSGGANSVRAWAVRELGPGSYHIIPDTTTIYHQSGDIKLDLNLEYRSHLFWKLEAAAFIDAGNIWTIRKYEGQEGGEFDPRKFYKQIALGYGLGLRLDFDYFLVRFDCGWKVYNPEKDGKDKWAVLHPNFTNNWAWHFAVGYPF